MGFWQEAQRPLAVVEIPWRLRSDSSITSMLSRLPPGWAGDICGGTDGGLGQTEETTGSCAEDTRAGAGGGDMVAVVLVATGAPGS